MRYHELTEAPIDIHQVVHDRDNRNPDVSSFRGDDKGIMASAKGVEKIKRVWQSSVCDVILYMCEVNFEPSYALDVALDSGYEPHTSHLRDFTAPATPGAITVVLTQNEGARRMPLTGWMIAHRLFHAFQNPRHGENHYSAFDLEGPLARLDGQMRGVLFDLSNNAYLWAKPIDLAQLMGQTKACRDRNLSNWPEFIPETWAQYMLRGKVTLNRLPQTFEDEDGATHTMIQGNRSFCDHAVESLEKWLNNFYAEIVEIARGKVFAL